MLYGEKEEQKQTEKRERERERKDERLQHLSDDMTSVTILVKDASVVKFHREILHFKNE